ncbi:hypothetical protein IGI04_037654 [Brassica rapa subsp. trilocularis]|uniref:Uncharacterized protein n=1 Tax=Brassica rapa subsp. trilocularis TaxID=1813537 RepID=A0ABQ7LI42_BRACM|nr:hypothetical protein IGI04_037654 [Brassica rapa subsp. trilocularis]
MEGLIPFLYKAMETSCSTPPVYFEHQSSGDLGPTVLDCLKRRLLHHLACPLGTSRNVRTFKYVLPRFSNCSEDSEGFVLIAGSSVHGSKSNLKTAAKREGSHIESLEAAIYRGTVNEHRHSDLIKKSYHIFYSVKARYTWKNEPSSTHNTVTFLYEDDSKKIVNSSKTKVAEQCEYNSDIYSIYSH